MQKPFFFRTFAPIKSYYLAFCKMSQRVRQLISLCLLAVYVFFFASANLFYHAHYQDNNKIVHSHIWNGKAHTHTAGEVMLIDQLNLTPYQGAEQVTVDLTAPIVANPVMVICQVAKPHTHSGFIFSLRAPPSYRSVA